MFQPARADFVVHSHVSVATVNRGRGLSWPIVVVVLWLWWQFTFFRLVWSDQTITDYIRWHGSLSLCAVDNSLGYLMKECFHYWDWYHTRIKSKIYGSQDQVLTDSLRYEEGNYLLFITWKKTPTPKPFFFFFNIGNVNKTLIRFPEIPMGYRGWR